MTSRLFRESAFARLALALLALLIISACSQGSQGPTASSLMPGLSGYQTNDTLNIQDAIAKITGVAAVGTGQPEIAAAITAINGLVSCYQQAGAVQGRSFVQSADPLKAGLIVIVDRNAVSNPKTFLSCILPKTGVAAAQAATQYQP